MMDAVRGDDVAAVRELVGRDPALASAKDEHGASAVLTAVYYGAREVAQLLVDSGIELDVWEAAAYGDAARVWALTDTAPALVRALSHDGWTPLHLGAFFGHADVARRLLSNGADVHAYSANGMANQPLHAACANGKCDLAALLLGAGADPNAPARGYAPLHLAAQNGDLPLIELLIEKGADPNAREDGGKTPLAMAAEAGETEAVALLRRHGGLG